MLELQTSELSLMKKLAKEMKEIAQLHPTMYGGTRTGNPTFYHIHYATQLPQIRVPTTLSPGLHVDYSMTMNVCPPSIT